MDTVHGDDFTVLGNYDDLFWFFFFKKKEIMKEFEIKIRGRLGRDDGDEEKASEF